MKYFVLSLLLLATVSGEQGENKLSKDLGEMLDSTPITKSIKDASKTFVSNETTFGDFQSVFNKSTSDSKPKSVSERNVTLEEEDLFIKGMRRKCNTYGTPDNFKDVLIAFDNFTSCFLGRKESFWTELNNKDLKMEVMCRLASEAGDCFINLLDASQPCQPRYKGGNFPFSNIIRATIDYACVDQAAQERAKWNVVWFKTPTYADSRKSTALAYGMERIAREDGMERESAKLDPRGYLTEGNIPNDIEVPVNLVFAGNWFECIERNMNELQKCFNSSFTSGDYPDLEENTYLFSEEYCRKMNEFKSCAVREMNTTCNPSMVNFLEGLERVEKQFYTPCPTTRHSEDVNLIS